MYSKKITPKKYHDSMLVSGNFNSQKNYGNDLTTLPTIISNLTITVQDHYFFCLTTYFIKVHFLSCFHERENERWK